MVARPAPACEADDSREPPPVDVAGLVGCTGIIVDAKDDGAERFYANYGFVTVNPSSCAMLRASYSSIA